MSLSFQSFRFQVEVGMAQPVPRPEALDQGADAVLVFGDISTAG
jgi:hypothetical protein